MKQFIGVVVAIALFAGIVGGVVSYIVATDSAPQQSAAQDGRGGDSNFDSVVVPSLTLQNAGATGGIVHAVSQGSCNTGTSTIISVLNPTGATSTARLVNMQLTGNATTTTLNVGTSTVSAAKVSTDVSNSLVTAASVSTSTGYYTSSGVRAGSGVSYLDPGAGSYQTIVVGPTQYIVGFATSTATGAGAAQYVGGYGTSCTYEILWMY